MGSRALARRTDRGRPTRKLATDTTAGGGDDCQRTDVSAACAFGFTLVSTCRSSRTADRVIPVSTQLGDGAGGDPCVLAVETSPSCFDLHVAHSGWWGGAEARDSPSVWGRHRRLGWWALNDRGGEYWGQFQGGHSGSTSVVEVSSAPALNPRANALTLEFPSPFDDQGVIRSTIELPTIESPT
jgi:hypothetical protein